MKFTMNASLVMLSLMLSGSVFAISDTELIEKCTPPATAEIYRLANVRECVVIDDNITLTDIDNRLLNPSKYLRFNYQAKCKGHENLLDGYFIAQYHNGKCYVSND